MQSDQFFSFMLLESGIRFAVASRFFPDLKFDTNTTAVWD